MKVYLILADMTKLEISIQIFRTVLSMKWGYFYTGVYNECEKVLEFCSGWKATFKLGQVLFSPLDINISKNFHIFSVITHL